MFFINVIHLKWHKFDMEWNPPDHDDLSGDSTCWGYVSDFELAKKIVLENKSDIFENGSYNLAVIEEIGEGIPSTVDNETWFSAKPILGGRNHIIAYDVEEIDKPKRFTNIIGWSLD